MEAFYRHQAKQVMYHVVNIFDKNLNTSLEMLGLPSVAVMAVNVKLDFLVVKDVSFWFDIM